MAVYVDDPIWPFRAMMMCHMIADEMEQLLEMVDKIGVKRKWIQQGHRCTHFDICKSKREKAIRAGAIECDRKTFVSHMRRIQAEKAFAVKPASTNLDDY